MKDESTDLRAWILLLSVEYSVVFPAGFLDLQASLICPGYYCLRHQSRRHHQPYLVGHIISETRGDRASGRRVHSIRGQAAEFISQLEGWPSESLLLQEADFGEAASNLVTWVTPGVQSSTASTPYAPSPWLLVVQDLA